MARLVTLDDGRSLVVRPITPSDSTRLRALHRSLSAETVYQRFFGLLEELPAARAEQFATVDGVDRQALVAVDDSGALVAVGRYTRLARCRDTAEVAFVVRDDYQRHGLGTALIRLLIHEARDHGVVVFVADVLTTNSAMHHAFADAGLVGRASYDHGVAHLEMAL